MVVFYIMVLLLLLILVISIIYLSYWVPKNFGNKKLGIILSRILIIGLIVLALVIIFDDYIFFKSDAKEYLAQQHVVLEDNFTIQNNESSGIMDYFHSFKLEISEKDKMRIIAQIKAEDTYQDTINNRFHLPTLAKNRYKGDTLYANYQTEWAYKKALFYANGEGYTPTYRVISVSKEKNELTFEEILE